MDLKEASQVSDLTARFAAELEKSEALRGAVAHVHRGSAGRKDAARLIWSLGYITGKQDGLAQAQEIMGGKA